jgi:hypothetical protein
MSSPEGSFFARLRSALPRVAAGLIAAAADVLAVVLITGGDDGEKSDDETQQSTAAAGDSELATIQTSDSSWVRGQGSLVAYNAYLTVADRAEELARLYQEARDAEVAEQERLARLARDEAEKAARRRALAAYRAALREAARQRKLQAQRLAEQRRRIKEKLARLREKYKVEPGEECQIPEVAAAFDCETGYPF